MEPQKVQLEHNGFIKTKQSDLISLFCFVLAKPLLNLALKKHAKQSTTDLGYNASRAVDGCKDSRFSKGCCAKTEKGSHTWWRVSLTSVYKISAVTIIGSDLSSSGSLQGALIRIGHNQLHESQM